MEAMNPTMIFLCGMLTGTLLAILMMLLGTIAGMRKPSTPP